MVSDALRELHYIPQHPSAPPPQSVLWQPLSLMLTPSSELPARQWRAVGSFVLLHPSVQAGRTRRVLSSTENLARSV